MATVADIPEFEFLEEVDSTNEHLKRRSLARIASGGTVVGGACCYAFRQSAGRGRNGRAFDSGQGGLYISFLRPGIPSAAEVTIKSSVRVLKILEDFLNISLRIKWVNDIMLDGRKCAGILAESSSGFHIVGIGVNVFNAIPDGLRDRAVSIREGEAADESLLHSLARAFRSEWDKPLGEDWMRLYKERSSCLGRRCLLTDFAGNRVAEGVVEDFREDGSIVIGENGISRPYFSGELSYSLRTI